VDVNHFIVAIFFEKDVHSPLRKKKGKKNPYGNAIVNYFDAKRTFQEGSYVAKNVS
jgi:hypothetical protein